MHNLTLSDTTYDHLMQAAKARNLTPEQMAEWMINQQPIGFATNENDFFRALGVSDERLAAIDARLKDAQHQVMQSDE